MDQKYINDMYKSDSSFKDPSNIAPPPPPCSTQLEAQTVDSQQTSSLTSGAADYPPRAYHTQAPARILHINYGNWKVTRISVLDTDEETPLYNVKVALKKPQMTFEPASSETPFATIVFHALHTRIDATIRDSIFTMTTHFSLNSLYSWASPALQGATLTWKSKLTKIDLECVDEKGVVVAMFHFAKISMKKAGRLEVMDRRACDDNPAFLEEIMVTGLAFACYMEVIYVVH